MHFPGADQRGTPRGLCLRASFLGPQQGMLASPKSGACQVRAAAGRWSRALAHTGCVRLLPLLLALGKRSLAGELVLLSGRGWFGFCFFVFVLTFHNFSNEEGQLCRSGENRQQALTCPDPPTQPGPCCNLPSAGPGAVPAGSRAGLLALPLATC